MTENSYIQIDVLCRHYQIEANFFERLDEIGLIETFQTESQLCVKKSQVNQIDKILRLYLDLEINPEGIDVILNLLNRIDELERALIESKNRLALHE